MSRVTMPFKRVRRAEPEDFALPRPGAHPGVHHLFAGVPNKIIEKIAAHGTVYRVQSNVAIRVQEHDPESDDNCPLLYILEGHLHIEFEKNGRSVVVGTLGPGDLCGEVENVLHCPSAFTIVSVGVLTYVDIEPARLLFEIADETLLRNLYQSACRKLKNRAGRVGLQQGRDTAALVREYLYNLAREVGVEKNGRLRCKESLNELALQIGISRQSVRNALEQITDFAYDDKHIEIRDPEILKEIRSGRPNPARIF